MGKKKGVICQAQRNNSRLYKTLGIIDRYRYK